MASGAAWASLGAIILANILLSGDNAVIIAMAARSLPERQQKKAIFWGSTAAIAMRVVLTALAVQLLRLPYLKIIGSVALLWIGLRIDRRSLRLGGLALFVAAGAKVIFSDLADLDIVWRLLAFAVLGGAMLLAAFAYLRARKP